MASPLHSPAFMPEVLGIIQDAIRDCAKNSEIIISRLRHVENALKAGNVNNIGPKHHTTDSRQSLVASITLPPLKSVSNLGIRWTAEDYTQPEAQVNYFRGKPTPMFSLQSKLDLSEPKQKEVKRSKKLLSSLPKSKSADVFGAFSESRSRVGLFGKSGYNVSSETAPKSQDKIVEEPLFCNEDVFLVQCLVEALPMQISSFVSYGDRLLIATAGSVLVYVISETPSFDIRLVDSRKGFAKKQVSQMAVVFEASLLLVIEENTLHSYDLHSLAFRESFPASKGCSLIAVFPPSSTNATSTANGFSNNEVLAYNGLLTEDQSVSTNVSHVAARASITSRLIAAVVKKKILIYKSSTDGTLRIVKELQTPDRAHTLLWLNSNTIAYAHPKRGYFTVSLDSNAITELYKFNSSYFSVGSVSGIKLGIAQLPKNQLMLTNNNAGVFVNEDGSPLIERDLEWSGPPDYISFSAPYVVALIAGSVEVRSLTTGGIVQQTEFYNSQTLVSGADSLIHVSSLNCIWRLLPVSFEDQIEHLIALSQFIEAQRLIEELEFSSEEEKISNIIRVRGLYAHHMFTTEKKYEAAISILSELRASPIDIVNLFPQFSLLGPSSDPPVSDKVALAALKDYLILQRQILSKLRKLHQRPNHLPLNQIPPLATSSGTTEATATIAASSLFSGSDHGVPDAVPFPATVLANAEDAVFLSSVVDTTLLKVYLMVNEALVGSLVRVENYCDLQEAEIALKAKNKYRELIEFYYGKGLHRKALENLSDPNGIITYLQKLDINAHVELFTEFVWPVFEMDVAKGMGVFTDRYEEIPLKTHLKILNFFEHRSSALETQYLEYLINDLGSEQPEFHDRLVLLYLQVLIESLTTMDGSPPKTEGRLFDFDSTGVCW
ncbi:UNVERIFIED_CONTAM: Vam6/Vps39-like protein [Siphonaria sp. JEL0065]|nr:Vam6/Vps39-like protein [Siphonaria sp. JEL0065]